MERVIAIQGVDLVNKGAELMLLATMQRMQQAGYILGTGLRCGSFRQRNEMGVHHLPWFFYGKLPANLTIFLQNALDGCFRVLPEKRRKADHILLEKEISVVLDASGFGYSDQFGEIGLRKTKIAAHSVRRWKQAGKKIIFLPQAFGPFRHPHIKRDMAQILRYADLVFARDETSLAYLDELVHGGTGKIKLAPDFTCLVQGRLPEYFDPDRKRACLIPNTRMIDRTESGTGEKYKVFLSNCLSYLIEEKCDPFILIHEDHDLALAVELQARFPGQVDIVQEPDPLFVKGILGTCSFVISSRYHGLVSALSQNVPSLATGWSHKYKMLLADYGCPECLLEVGGTKQEIIQKIDMIRYGQSREDLSNRLQMAASEQRRLSLAMWQEVFEVLGGY
jgi:colanic acid/amylovoran biosynthesis protein